LIARSAPPADRPQKDPRRWSERRAVPRLLARLRRRIAAGGTRPPPRRFGFFENSPSARAPWAWGFWFARGVFITRPPPIQTSGGARTVGLGFWDPLPILGDPTPRSEIFENPPRSRAPWAWGFPAKTVFEATSTPLPCAPANPPETRDALPHGGPGVSRPWSGSGGPVSCHVRRIASRHRAGLRHRRRGDDPVRSPWSNTGRGARGHGVPPLPVASAILSPALPGLIRRSGDRPPGVFGGLEDVPAGGAGGERRGGEISPEVAPG
jgi:hypothetical protein